MAAGPTAGAPMYSSESTGASSCTTAGGAATESEPLGTASRPGACTEPDQDDVRGKELMPFDDGSLTADKAQSSAMSLVINYTEPLFAAGAAVFGLSLLVMPLLVRLQKPGLKKAGATDGCRKDLFSYDGLVEDVKQVSRLFKESELRHRLGTMDASALLRELTMGTEELDQHISASGADATDEEVARIQKWKDKANTNLRSLQKRSALAFLGLPPDANESDVGKMYKKMALELHPDKGGDPEKFQELQEMRERLNDADRDDKDEDDEDGAKDAEKKSAKDALDEETQKLPPDERAKKLRVDAHENVLRVWERAKKARDEIVGDKAIKSNAQPALNMLRVFVDRFVASEVKPLKHGDAKGADAKFRKFIQQGAEILAVAAIHDVQGALSTVAMTFNYRLVARSGSAEVKNQCAALLEAIAEVPAQAEAFLKAVEDGLELTKDREKKDKEERAAQQRAREAQGDFSGDAGGLQSEAQEAGNAPAAPTAPPASRQPNGYPSAQPQQHPTTSAQPKAADPFADFDFDKTPGAASRVDTRRPPETLAKKSEGGGALVEKRTRWDPEFDHPYAGALKADGTGIFCRPCQRWINTYEYNVEVFNTHCIRAHPQPPPGWDG
eukprot:TRINITY_DN112229_c0_g1_i1.p1 TRINITY_DN112229_c0_g1~~TRINITY_DN112229_c0_g1_i1.p1  ORF type:complete len:614 (-),score=169.64 TRINITY_DN112229_c0_g1_i1:80-1921(-)